jgi:hypothetical protein
MEPPHERQLGFVCTNAAVLMCLHVPASSQHVLTVLRLCCSVCGRMQGLQRVKLKRTLVVHGCSSNTGSPAVLDFSDLQVRSSS